MGSQSACRRTILAVILLVVGGTISLYGCSKERTRVVQEGVNCLSVVPMSGPLTGGTGVTVSGIDFQPGAVVRFGQAAATGVTVRGDGREITCQTPSGPPGWVDVVVWNPDGVGCRIVNGFEYLRVPPQIDVVTYANSNMNCAVDVGDTVDVTFTKNVTFTVSDPSQAFQFPVAGDGLGTGAQFLGGGMPTDVAAVTIVLGTAPVLEPGGTFSPTVLTAGSPSGIDITSTPGLAVDAAFPSVSALPRNPPGADLSGAVTAVVLWSSSGLDQIGAQFGHALASAGDVDGDGYADVIIGAPDYASSGQGGNAHLYRGGPAGLSTSLAWSSSGDGQPDAHFGSAVASAGDVNGDGYDDVLVGARDFDGTFGDVGKAYLYLGGPGGLSTLPAWTSSGDEVGPDRYGLCVASGGDVNNDGFDDIIVGASHNPPPASYIGKVYVYHGNSGSVSMVADWASVGDDQAFANFGSGCAGSGDVNGDGFSDIIVGAGGSDTPEENAGKAYLYRGGPGGLETSPAWTSSGEDIAWSQFGSSVAGAGDVNKDGFSDVIVGANIFGGRVGKAYVYFGGPTGLSTTAAWSSSGDGQADAWFGQVVSSAGDVNGDAFSDILVAATSYDTLFDAAGKAYLYLGGPTGVSASPTWTSNGDDQQEAWFGRAIAPAGDVDGNGSNEILVGAPGFDTPKFNAGKAYLYCVGP